MDAGWRRLSRPQVQETSLLAKPSRGHTVHMASAELDEDAEAIRTLFWRSIQSNGVAADILMRMCADVLFVEPEDR